MLGEGERAETDSWRDFGDGQVDEGQESNVPVRRNCGIEAFDTRRRYGSELAHDTQHYLRSIC
jgi:hypothetical protein